LPRHTGRRKVPFSNVSATPELEIELSLGSSETDSVKTNRVKQSPLDYHITTRDQKLGAKPPYLYCSFSHTLKAQHRVFFIDKGSRSGETSTDINVFWTDSSLEQLL